MNHMVLQQTQVMFVIYILVMILIGWLGYRATRNFSDYILGGRRLGSWVTALSAGASDMSAWLLMGLPGAVYLFGFSKAWIGIGLILGAWLNWRFVAKRLRIYTEHCGNALTLPDFLASRFEDCSQILRIITAVVILIFFTLYSASGIVAGAKLFQNLFDISYSQAVWPGACATIVYVFIGGFLAVSWTDAIQASLMFTALMLVPAFVLSYLGYDTIIGSMHQMNPGHFSWFSSLGQDGIWQNVGWVAVVSSMAWGLGYFGQPHILIRFMASESANTIPKARKISMTWMILCMIGAIAVGWFGRAYFNLNPSALVTRDEEMVFVALAQILFHPLIAGVLLAAILAAVMSTLSCQLLICASTLTRDIYNVFLNKQAPDQHLVWLGRIMVLAISLVAIVLAQNPDSRILQMVSNAWAGFGAAFGPVVLGSLFWKRMTRNGALAGMVVGAATVILWINTPLKDLTGLYEIVPGFILASFAILIVSLLDRKPSERIQHCFGEVQTYIK